MPNTHRLKPGQRVELSKLSTRGKDFYADGKDQAEAEFKALREELVDWQNRWYAEGKRKLLIVFQAMDAGGKDGTIRSVLRGVNPQGCRVWSFKAPSAEELAHDFLWRIHHRVPERGMMGVFNRSHYEDVLVVRVDEIVPESVWRPRYALINAFEQMLHETGTTILKFYLHISAKEQLERFTERQNDPAKRWKFSAEDFAKRDKWDDYMVAYEEALEQCTTSAAPWYVIPADQNWYRDLAIARVLVDTLRELNPQYPTPTASE